jgi:hypothetical protein
MVLGVKMKERLIVESFDGKAKILAELDVVKKLEDDKIIVHLFGSYYKEMTYQKEGEFWKVTKEVVDASSIN